LFLAPVVAVRDQLEMLASQRMMWMDDFKSPVGTVAIRRSRRTWPKVKIERWHKSLKGECIRPGTPLSLDDARRLVQGYVDHYNSVRLNSATGYNTPKDMLAGRQ
jgi:transposase InsO family protein